MMSLNLIIVSYDICDKKRLRKVHETMKGYGEGVHYSVFRCCLDRKGVFEMIADLDEKIHHDEDRIMIIDLGPEDTAEKRLTYLGDVPEEKEKDAIII